MAVTLRGARPGRAEGRSPARPAAPRPALVLAARGSRWCWPCWPGCGSAPSRCRPARVVLTLLDRALGALTGTDVSGGLDRHAGGGAAGTAAAAGAARRPRRGRARHLRRRLPGRLPQPARRPLPARRRGRAPGSAPRWSSPTPRRSRSARSGSSRWPRSSARWSASGPRWPWAPRPAARRAPPCCSPASPWPRSSPPRRPSSSSRTPTTCARSTAGCSASSVARSGPTSCLVLPYLGTAVVVLLLCGRALDVLAVGDDEAQLAGGAPGPAAAAGHRRRLAGHRVGRRGQRADRLRRPGRAARRPPAGRRLVRTWSCRSRCCSAAPSWCSPTWSPASCWPPPSCPSASSPPSSAPPSSPACSGWGRGAGERDRRAASRSSGSPPSYGRTRVLDRVRLTVEPGGWLAVIGPNGSGKSTLLRCDPRAPPARGAGPPRRGDRPRGMPRRDRARQLAYAPQLPVLPEGVTTRRLRDARPHAAPALLAAPRARRPAGGRPT